MPENNKQTKFDFTDELVGNSKIFKNFNQEFIVTTVDKIKLCLNKHQKALKAQMRWMTPLGILLALFITLITADFKTNFGQPPEFWKAFFLILMILSAGWFIIELIKSIRSFIKGDGKVNNIVKELKKNSPTNYNESNEDYEKQNIDDSEETIHL